MREVHRREHVMGLMLNEKGKDKVNVDIDNKHCIPPTLPFYA